MGCLNVHIENQTVCDVKIDITKENVNAALSVTSYNTPILVNTKQSNTVILVNTENNNTHTSINTECKNTKISIKVGLVCQVSLGEYKLFYVAEGPFMVEEGYFKVKGM